MNKGMVIATTANIPTQSQQQQQPQQQQIVRSQLQGATTIQLQAPQPGQPVQPQQQQMVQQQPQQVQQQQIPQQQQQIPQQRPPIPPPAQQQVQLRVSNDEVNRQFCLSWLKATYETAANGTVSIEQQVMYKQYLASLHKIGKKDVISAQHYAVCVRTLFGGSVGPNRKAMPDG